MARTMFRIATRQKKYVKRIGARNYMLRKSRLRFKVNIYNYKQSVDGASQAGGFNSRTIVQTGAAQNGGIIARLSDLVQASTYTGLYDQYRINKVVIKFIPMSAAQVTINSTYGTTAGSGVIGAANNPGMLHTCVDTDGGFPTTLAAIEQYSSYKCIQAFSAKTHTMVVTPGVFLGVQDNSGGTVAGATKKRQWIDCGVPNANHYIGGWYLDPVGTQGVSSAQTWQIQMYYYVSFRNVR